MYMYARCVLSDSRCGIKGFLCDLYMLMLSPKLNILNIFINKNTFKIFNIKKICGNVDWNIEYYKTVFVYLDFQVFRLSAIDEEVYSKTVV